MKPLGTIRQAVVLAAGEGRRLEPFSLTRPKCALPLANRPLIRWAVESLTEAGVEEIFVVVGYKAELIRKALEGTELHGVHITYIEQKKLEGPIHGVLEARDRLRDKFIVLSADCFVRPEIIGEAVDLLESTGCACVLGSGVCDLPLYHHQASCDDSGRLTDLRQVLMERQRAETNMLCGLCVARAEVLKEMEKFAKGREDEWSPFFGYLAKKTDVRVTHSGFKFVHLDYPWEIRDDVVKDYMFKKTPSQISPSVRIEDGVKIEGRHVIEDDVFIEHGTVIKDTWIGKGTQVYTGSYVQNAVIGNGCHIGPLCVIKEATVGHGSRISHFAEYVGAVALGRASFWHQGHISGVWGNGAWASVCCSTTERRGVIKRIEGADGEITYESEVVKVRICGELISSGLDSLACFVGDGAALSVGVKVMPGRKIGPNCHIGPNVVVYRDVPPNTSLVLRQSVESRCI
jgi:bifunctional UDP-N-acetylglucosamine pyrophosphorylase/glucosamine-1-phosphate N-acetyltransferase